MGGLLDVPGVTRGLFSAQRARELRDIGKPVMSGAPDANPVVTLGPANASTTIANSQLWAAVVTGAIQTGRFRLRGGSFSISTFGGYSMPYVSSPVDPPVPSLAYTIDFAIDTAVTEILVAATGTTMSYRVWVDGRVIPGTSLAGAYTATTSGNATYLIKLDWTSVAPPWGKRAVRVDLSGATFGGVYLAREGRVVAPAENQRVVRSAWVGDSFLEGTNAQTIWQAMAHTAAPLLGWDEVVMDAQGGTGYLNPGVITGRGTLRSRLPALIALAPDVVVVAAGYNDVGTYTAGQIGTEAGLYYTQLRAGLPNAKVWAAGPWSLYAPPDSSLTAAGAQIRTAVTAINGSYIDMYTDPWITGTGTAASPPSPLNGNASLYVTSGADPHPPPAGHTFYGYEFAAAIASTLTA